MFKVFYNPIECLEIGYRENCEAWDMSGMHYHNAYELYMLTEGERIVSVNDQEFTLKPWELLIIKPYVLHSFRCGTDTISRHVMNIPQEIFSGFLKSDEIAYLTDCIPNCIIEIEPERRAVIEEFFAQTKRYNYRSSKIAGKVALCCLVHFMEYLKDLLPGAKRILDADTPIIRPVVLKAIMYIHDMYTNEEFQLDDVVEHVHMSKSRFCEIFREAAGMTFLKYLNMLRVTALEKEIWSTQKPLHELACKYGFSSTAHMTRIFNEVYRTSPTEYRKNYLEKYSGVQKTNKEEI